MKPKKTETVKIKVLIPFRDKFDKKIHYEAGMELEFDSERAEDVVTRELAEYVESVG